MPPATARVTIAADMAAVFNLNHPAHVITWHFISLSVANVIVIAVMLVVFALAILLPFPRGEQAEPQ